MPPYRPDLKYTARELRANATKEENRLWYDFLSKYPVRFLRQRPIGNYIVDFYCPSQKLAIELDGKQHQQADAVAYDRERTDFLNAMGVSIIRFTNSEINNHFNTVLAKIKECVPNPKSPLPVGRGCRPQAAGDVQETPMPEKLKPLEILAIPENLKCTCPETDCEWHGNCRDCVSLHRYHATIPNCLEIAMERTNPPCQRNQK